jgi:hypothetical protein
MEGVLIWMFLHILKEKYGTAKEEAMELAI